jgi:hypothetical protein
VIWLTNEPDEIMCYRGEVKYIWESAFSSEHALGPEPGVSIDNTTHHPFSII